MLCGTSGGFDFYCFDEEISPSNDGQETAVSVIIQSDVEGTSNFEVTFTVLDDLCFSPRITFVYAPIDNDASGEWMQLYDDEGLLLKSCTSGQQAICHAYYPCVEDRSLSVPFIDINDTYTLTVKSGPELHILGNCSLSVDALLTLTCAGSSTPTPTTEPSMNPVPSPSFAPTHSPS